MANNLQKYFSILEELTFLSGDINKTNEKQRFEGNLKILRKYIKCQNVDDYMQLEKAKELFDTLPQTSSGNTKNQKIDDDQEMIYVVYLQHILLVIVKGANFDSDAKEDLISIMNLNLCKKAVEDLAFYGLSNHLHDVFYNCKLLKIAKIKLHQQERIANFNFLRVVVETVTNFIKIKQFHTGKSMEEIISLYMAGVFSLLVAHAEGKLPLNDVQQKQLQENLDYIWNELTKLDYFRNLIIFQGMRYMLLPHKILKNLLHHEMMRKLVCPDGFVTLVGTLRTAITSRSDITETFDIDRKTSQVVANIVANLNHTHTFQAAIIKQIFKFFHQCLWNETMMESMGTGLYCLKRLYVNNDDNRKQIRNALHYECRKLIEPEDLISGLILMDNLEFISIVSLLYHMFCTSSVECLPSVLLVNYLPMLLQMYFNLPSELLVKHQLGSLVARCLSNRKPAELEEIIMKLYRNQNCQQQNVDNTSTQWYYLHERIKIVPNAGKATEVTLKIASPDTPNDFSISLALPELLMSVEHHWLTYQIFMTLMRQLSKIIEENLDLNEISSALLQTEEELVTFLNAKYPAKVEILLTLNVLITYQPLKSQISEHIKEFLLLLQELVEKRIQPTSGAESASAQGNKDTETADQILLIMLTLAQEFLESTEEPEMFRNIIPKFKKIQLETPNRLVKQKINTIIALLSGDLKANLAHKTNDFQMARTLIECQESHLQVYGIQMLLDLLRRNDAVAKENYHTIVALALTLLKDKESYTFLNCVRLFVALVNVMEAQVVEILTDEYLLETNSVDFRLVIGEAVLKIAKELGPLSYKYKEALVKCFLLGIRSKIDELTMSAYSNLSQLCRILSYQVHNFFQELLSLIDFELNNGSYLPTKRAAILVLSELLEGIESLKDFEEMLSPIYQLLKKIVTNEDLDIKMRTHAANGLKALNEKCREFLFPEVELQKEFKFFGIKDEPKSSGGSGAKKHILELT